MIWAKIRGACLAAGLAALAMAGSAWAQPAPTPFICEGELYHLASTAHEADDPSTTIRRIDGETYAWPGEATFLSIPGVALNGLAFNPQDNFLYAITNYESLADFSLYRLGSNTEWVHTPIDTSLLSSTDRGNFGIWRNSGTFDAQGNLFITSGGSVSSQRLYVITGVDTWTPQIRRVVINPDDVPPLGYSPQGPIDVADLAYSHSESSASTAVLYGTRRRVPNNSSGVLNLYRVKVDLTANPPRGKGSRIAITATNFPVSDLTYGAAYIDQRGDLLVSANDNSFYRIDRASGSMTRLTSADGSSSNTDGTTCRALPQIDVVKAAGTPQAVLNGHTFDVPYTLTVGNTGKVPAPNVQISENLSATFNAGSPGLSISSAPNVTAGSCTVNAGFNGTSDYSLLAGTDTLAPAASCTVTFTVRVAYPDATSVPGTPQLNTAYASVAASANAGHTWPDGATNPPAPPADVVAHDESSNGPNLPPAPNSDTPTPTPVTLRAGQVTFAKTIASGANPAPGGTVEYTITVRNSGPVPVNFPAGSIVDNLPANTTHAGSDAFTCAGSNCTNTVPVTVPANGNVALPFRVTVNAGVAGGTNIVNTIVPPAGNSCASPVACEASTPVVIPASDMSVAINGLPSVISPGATVTGQIVCTAGVGPWPALNATCTATGEDNNGDLIGVTVGTCTPPTPVASLPVGNSITCAISYTAPGTPGGSDTPQTSVTVTATTGASNDSNPGNNTVTSTATIIDAVDDTVPDRPAGATGETYDVSGNDRVPAGSTFTLGAGSTCANPAMSTAGVATFDVPGDGSSCTVVYQVCAPAPNATTCDTAVLTVTPAPRAVDDTRPREPGNTPTVVPVLGNDPDGGAAAPGSVELVNPPAGATLEADGKTMTVPGQGVWTVNADNTVTFTPEDGFTGAPTPIDYTFADAGGVRSNAAKITLSAALRAVDDTRPREPGNAPTVVSVLGNDPDRAAAAPNSVELANPPAGATLEADGKTMTVPGQGVWTVNADNTVTFTPEDGFTGAPTPIDYTFANADGVRSNVASITLSVAAAPGAVTPVPTLSQWSLLLLAALLGAAGLRRRVGSR